MCHKCNCSPYFRFFAYNRFAFARTHVCVCRFFLALCIHSFVVVSSSLLPWSCSIFLFTWCSCALSACVIFVDFIRFFMVLGRFQEVRAQRTNERTSQRKLNQKKSLKYDCSSVHFESVHTISCS